MCKLEFGIPSLDQLISPQPGREFNTGAEPGVVCIMGPDGVGKSVLALHLASNFWRQQVLAHANQPVDDHPAIFYFSTDLKYSQAAATWKAFGLDQPSQRRTELQRFNLFSDGQTDQPGEVREPVHLQWVEPISRQDVSRRTQHSTDVQYLEHLLEAENWRSEVQFIDLATRSAGDDWHLINRLTGFLAGLVETGESTAQPANSRQHLIIVDAVEGLEALVGHHDVFGQPRDRRSRVAQLARLAKKACAHLVFIIEEIRTDIRLPEEFVADLVIRLRSVKEKDYDRRTVEVEKARGVAHVRGQHDISLRMKERHKDNGSLDHPSVPWVPSSTPQTPPSVLPAQPAAGQIAEPELDPHTGDHAQVTGNPKSSLAYVQVFRSLHARRRKDADRAVEVRTFCDFFTPHVAHLNSLLEYPQGQPTDLEDRFRLTVLLGDSGTFKGRLGRNFLAQPFATSDSRGVSILVTLRSVTNSDVAKHLIKHLTTGADEEQIAATRFQEAFRERLLVRTIASHYLTSNGLFHLLEIYVKTAQDRIRAMGGGEIRLVLDDWNGLLAAHPNLAADPLLLQALQEFVEDRQLNALLISTQPGIPSLAPNTRLNHDLRILDTRHIYTWPVQFFGTRRIAVTTYPPTSIENPPLIYELCPRKTATGELDNERLDIDRHFSLYAGLESGEPQRIPLKVRLYAGYHAHPEVISPEQSYITQVRHLFGDISPPPKGESAVVDFDHIEHYLGMKDSIQFQDDRRLDHTLVQQVDEFWAQSDDRLLLDLKEKYLEEVTSTEEVVIELNPGDAKAKVTWKFTPDKDADPHEAYQPLTPRCLHDLELWSQLQLILKSQRGRRRQTDPQTAELQDLETHVSLDPDFMKQIEVTFRPPTDSTSNPASTLPAGAHTSHNHPGKWSVVNPVSLPADASTTNGITNKGGPALTSLKLTRRRQRQSFIQPRQEADFPYTLQSEDSCRLIPYLWDFGFILARRDLWWQARDRIVEIDDASSGSLVSWTVGSVWDSLCIEKARFEQLTPDATPHRSQAVTWQLFLKTCQVVRGGLEIPMFDADLRTETMNSLVLEIWFSEIVKNNSFAFHNTSPHDCSLRTLLQDYALELYTALSLLFEYLPEIDVQGAEFQLRSANHGSVASRHWYSTANMALDKNTQYVPLANPGLFSARGDWSLCISASSRSQLLGQRAIDRLTSRQMNILRLHDGMGLPVRDIIHQDLKKELRTSLKYYNPDRNEQELILLDALAKLGAEPAAPDAGSDGGAPDLKRQWLWRSALRGYSRQSFYFYRWLARVFQHRIDCFPVEQTIRAKVLNSALNPTSKPAGNFQGGRPTRESEFLTNFEYQRQKLNAVTQKSDTARKRLAQNSRSPLQRTKEAAELAIQRSEVEEELLPFKYVQKFLELRDIAVGILREDPKPPHGWIELT